MSTTHGNADVEGRLPELITRDFDRSFRGLFRPHGPTEDDRGLRVRTGFPHPFGNLAFSNRSPTTDEVAADIADLVDDRVPSAYMCTEAVGEAAAATLIAAGFQLAEEMPLMALDLSRLEVPAGPEGCRITRATPETHDDWVDAMANGYELPRALVDPMGPRELGDRMDGDPIEFHVVHCEDSPVGSSFFTSRDGVVGIYCIATDPAYRGRGIGAWATAAPLVALRDAGHHTAVLQSSIQGAPVYRRLGFTEHGTMPLYVRIPASAE